MAGQKLVARAQPGEYVQWIERPVAAQIISDSACGIPRVTPKRCLKAVEKWLWSLKPQR